MRTAAGPYGSSSENGFNQPAGARRIFSVAEPAQQRLYDVLRPGPGRIHFLFFNLNEAGEKTPPETWRGK